MLYYSSKTTGLDLSSLTENLKLSNLLEAIQKVYILACLDLLYVMKNRKTTNISETMDIPSESSKEHPDIHWVDWCWISHMPFYSSKTTGPDLGPFLMEN